MIDIRKLELSKEKTKIEVTCEMTEYEKCRYKSSTVNLNVSQKGIYKISYNMSYGIYIIANPYMAVNERIYKDRTKILQLNAGNNEVEFGCHISISGEVPTVKVEVTLTRYNEIPIELSGTFETDVNTLPKLDEQYYNFGISDAYIKLDTAEKNKIAEAVDRDTPHAIYANGKLLTVMYFEDIEEIVNNTVKELYLTDNSDDIYNVPLSGNVISVKSLFILFDSRKESIGKPKVYDRVSFERFVHIDLEEFYFEDTSSREYIAWIQELAGVTVGISEGNFGVFEY